LSLASQEWLKNPFTRAARRNDRDDFRNFGAAEAGQVAILAVAALAFLPVPDVDLWMIRLLHHRSILTHSVLWPFLVLWFAAPLGLSPEQGDRGGGGGGARGWRCTGGGPAVAVAGLWAHLVAEPFQRSLGRWSRPWILGNGVGAAGLAFLWVPEGLRMAALGVGAVAALGYGIRRERSVLSALVALGVVGAGFWGAVSWGGTI
jgi:hypothetical protein